MTAEVVPEQRSRLDSCFTNYPPTITELLENSGQDVQRFLTKSKNDTEVCILRETTAQLRNKSLGLKVWRSGTKGPCLNQSHPRKGCFCENTVVPTAHDRSGQRTFKYSYSYAEYTFSDIF